MSKIEKLIGQIAAIVFVFRSAVVVGCQMVTALQIDPSDGTHSFHPNNSRLCFIWLDSDKVQNKNVSYLLTNFGWQGFLFCGGIQN